jgi:hypothetical protein
LKADDLFITTVEEDPIGWGADIVRRQLNEPFLQSLRRRPDEKVSDLEASRAALDLVYGELQAFGTDGSHTLDDRQIDLAIVALESVLSRLSIALRVPFRDFTRFRSHWIRNDCAYSWQARRDLLEALFEPVRLQIRQLEERPISTRLPHQSLDNLQDADVIHDHLWRLQRALSDDPAQVIGSAKELVESTAKLVLLERGISVDKDRKLPALIKEAQTALGLHTGSVAVGPDGSDEVKRILGAVANIAVGLAELRNRGYGTGHGNAARPAGLRPRHAHLAVNAAITWCQLMLDTLADSDAPWRKSQP